MAKTTRRPTHDTPPQRGPNVDRIRTHLEYLERRLQGGALATPEAYARAIQQWQQLPGAIPQIPVTNPPPPQPAPRPVDRGGVAPASDALGNE
jgi:hypothetical protein